MVEGYCIDLPQDWVKNIKEPWTDVTSIFLHNIHKKASTFDDAKLKDYELLDKQFVMFRRKVISDPVHLEYNTDLLVYHLKRPQAPIVKITKICFFERV